LKHLIATITALQEQEIEFRSLTEQIDTATPGGKLIFHIFGALAGFERDLIRERTQAGLAAARARGRKGGRPRALNTPPKVTMAQALYQDTSNDIVDKCRTLLHISRATLYRYLSRSTSSTEKPQPDEEKTIKALHITESNDK
jgi:DNA invertase Pin-like site-specific DNA recombinase